MSYQTITDTVKDQPLCNIHGDPEHGKDLEFGLYVRVNEGRIISKFPVSFRLDIMVVKEERNLHASASSSSASFRSRLC